MRFIGKAAIAMAIGTLAAMAPNLATAQDAGHRLAVVDVAFIFKNHPGIKSQVAAVENDLKSYSGEMQKKQEELKAAVEQIKAFKPGSAEYSAQEERVASLESKLRLDMARKKKELADAEARIYFDNYQRIADGVKFLAQHYKINLVLRYNSEDMDLEEGQSVIRGVMKNVVYHDTELDMTKGVMQYLDKFSVAEGANNAATR
ncbi:periplasmic chaperone [Rubripirellula lacrimiformis]|uniref:Periplasmic chaperone n=2 Tax=Rubripirellula lacrimiformis TaxID=1930273 RepID=A0A517NFM6_9BACT|nr:periplasmic chaperone [Rubripirellula lacrimiformis]